MKKKRLIILLSFLIPIFILTGLALWIVTTDHVITPAYDENHTLAQYFVEETNTSYDGNEKTPNFKDGVYTNDEDKENFLNTVDFYYKTKGTIGAYTEGLPTNAGTYSVKILEILDSNDNSDNQDGALYVTINISTVNPTLATAVSVSYANQTDGTTRSNYFVTSQNTSDITYTGSFKGVDGNTLEGTIKYSDTTYTSLQVGNDIEYSYTFTPSNSNYNTYSGKCKINTYATVTYKNYNNSVVNTLEVQSESKLTEPSHSTRDGYTWNGWYNGSIVWNFVNNTVTTNITLVENWTAINYTITYNLDGGTVSGTNPTTYTVNDTFTLINPTKTGFTFMGWTGTGITGTSKTVTIQKDSIGNRSYTATWGNPILIKLEDNTTAIYNAQGHNVTTTISINGSSSALPSGTSIKYQYKNSLGTIYDNFEDVIDADTYTVTATFVPDSEGIYSLDPSSIMSATLTISPLKIKVNDISITYKEALDATSLNWGKFNDLIYNKISFSQEDGTALPTGASVLYFFDGIDNNDTFGKYVYADNDSSDSSIVLGSTYYINIELIDLSANNFVISNCKSLYENGSYTYTSKGSAGILKYKTVLIGETYYTIEEALKEGGSIVLAGSSSTVFTSFTGIDYYDGVKDEKPTSELASGSSLWITYDGSTTATALTGTSDIYSVLHVPENVVLNAKGTVNVCGVVSQNAHATSGRGILFNNGTINLTGTLNSYGYVKGKGLVNVTGSGSFIDVIRFYNYTNSGGLTLSMSNANIFPMTVYSLHNASCKVKVSYTATYKVMYNVAISSVEISGFITMIGSGGMFALSNGYAIKYAEDTTGSFFDDKDNLFTNYSKTNQDKTQRDIVEIYGTFTDNVVSIKKSGQGIETGPNYAMPIGMMSILLKKDEDGNTGVGIMDATSYKFLPGSRINIDYGCEMKIASNINMVFYDETYDDTFTSSSQSGYINTISYVKNHTAWFNSSEQYKGSKLTVNGLLTAEGGFGGIAYTSNSQGKMVLTNASGAVAKMTNLEYSGTGDQISVGLGGTTATVKTDNVKARGYLVKAKGSTLGTLAPGTFYAKGDAWYTEKVVIYYDANGGILSGNSSEGPYNTGDDGYTFNVVNTTNPTRDYYTFTGWYSDPSCTNLIYFKDSTGKVTSNNYTTFTNMYVYAGWSANPYKITYQFVYDGCTDNSNIINSNETSYTVEQNIDLNTPASPDNYVFGGWYSDSALTNQINAIEGYLYGGDIIIYGKWYPKGTVTYKLEYYKDSELVREDNVVSIDKDTYPIPNPYVNSHNNNKEESTYFVGWYTTSTFDDGTLFTNPSSISSDLKLYAKFADKITITLYIGDSSSSEYYIPGDVKLPENKENEEILVWFTNAEKNSTTHYIGGISYDTILSDITLYSEYYYFVKATDYSSGVYSPSLEHANIYIKDLDLSSISLSVSTSIICTGGWSPSHTGVNTTKSGGFVSKNIEKIIINGSTLIGGNSDSDDCTHWLASSGYSKAYVGLFDSNPLKQVIAINQTSSTTLNNYDYLFSNCENTSFNASCIYSDVTFTASNNHFANDSGLVTSSPSEPSGTYTPVVN